MKSSHEGTTRQMQIESDFTEQLAWTILKLQYHERQKKGLGNVLDYRKLSLKYAP